MRLSQSNQGTLLTLTYKGMSKTTKKLQNNWFSGRDTHSVTFELKSIPLLLHQCPWYECCAYHKVVYKLQFWSHITYYNCLIQSAIQCNIVHNLNCIVSSLKCIK